MTTSAAAERPELELRTMDWYISKWQRFLKLYRRIQVPEEMAESLYYNSNLGYYYNYIAIDMYENSSTTLIFDCNDLANAMEAGMGVILDSDEVSNKKTADEALSFSDLQSLDNQLYMHPDEAVRALRQATYLIMKEIHHDYAMEIKDSFKARFRNCRTRVELPDINDNYMSKLVSVRGIVTEYDVKSSRIYYESAWRCAANHFTVVQGRNRPIGCDECSKKALTLVQDRVKTDSYQEFKIQQRHDKTKTGRMAVEFEIALIGTDMQNIVISGDYVNVTGIVRVREDRSHGNYGRQSDIAEFYIDASFVEKLPEDDILRLSEKDKAILREAVKEAVKQETEDIDFEILWRSVAPTIIGHEIEKKALLLQAAGTKRRKFDDGTISRGPNNLLFCGSPATAKTVLANWQKRVFHRAVAPTGDGLSKPGLTAAVDPRSGRSVLKPGAYVLANGGIVVIDELNVIKGDIMSALLEPMEDNQTVTISKGGIHRVLDARCASLHMCNPKGTTHWDDSKTIVENTGIQPPQLSRYDAIFVFRDIPDAVEDAKKFDHWTSMYGNSVTDDAFSDDQESMKEQPVILKRGRIGNLHSLPFMAFWRLYISDTFDAKLDVSPDSKPLQMLREFYLEMRNMDVTRFMSLDELEDQDEATIQKIPSITMRQIGSLIRLAEASANAHHRNIVLEKDAELAIEIVRYSILNSGFNQALNKAGIVDYAQRGGNPKVSYIEIEKLAHKKRDRWHKESIKLFTTFEQQLKRYALGKCLNCRGRGIKTIYQNMKEIQQDCSICNGLGSENLEFNIDHIRDNLKPRGFTQPDFEYVAETFLRYRIIEKNPRTGYYRLVKRYSITRGYGTVKFLEGISPEDIVDVEGAEQKTKELGQVLTAEEKEAMEQTMKRLEGQEEEEEEE